MNKFRILHTGDLHLDSPMITLGKLASVRKQELLETFANIIKIACEKNVDAVVIAGDLFDCADVSSSTINFVSRKFKEISHIPVFIALGNHDAGFTSDFHDNVHIFPDYIEKISVGNADIYGVSFAQEYCSDCILEGFEVENPAKINLLICHSDIVQNGQGSRYNPVTVATIANTNADYFATAHTHKFSDMQKANNVSYAYCGCPEGRGFDEIGAKGVLIVDIMHNHCEFEFVKTNKRQYIELNIDVSECEDYNQILTAVTNTAIGEENLYKINLKGETDILINTPSLTQLLEEKYFFIKLNDFTKPNIDLAKLSAEYTLKGLFIKAILEEGGNDNAIKYGLAALNGNKVSL